MEQNEPANDPFNLEYLKSLKGEAALAERLSGTLPVIDINGEPFFIKLFIMKIQSMCGLGLGLNLKKGGFYDGIAKEYFFYYDPLSMEEAVRDTVTGQYPKETLFVRFPDPYTLDAVGMAQRRGEAPETYLHRAPVVMYQTAEVLPLEKVSRINRTFFDQNMGKQMRQ